MQHHRPRIRNSEMLVAIRPSDRLAQLCKRRKEEAETIDNGPNRGSGGLQIGVKLSYHSANGFPLSKREIEADIIAQSGQSCGPVVVLCSIRNGNRRVVGSRTAALALLSGNMRE